MCRRTSTARCGSGSSTSGFVVWAEDRADGPRSDGGAQRLVIARDSGEATLWPALPVGEVIRRYEEEYGRADDGADAVPAPAAAGRPEPDVVPVESAGVVAGGGGQVGDSGSAGSAPAPAPVLVGIAS